MDDLAYFEDVRVGTVVELGTYVLGKEEIIRFAEEWAPSPFHADEAAASASPFGGIIASGAHTYAAFSRLLTREYLAGLTFTAASEVRMRLRAPVRPEEAIRVRVTVLGTGADTRRPDQGRVVLLGENIRADGTVAFEVTIHALVARRRPAPV